MYQIGNCACTKTAHILKVFELIVFCLFVALHWKTILFIVANAVTGHSQCFGHRIFRVPTRQCPAHRAKETVASLMTETPDLIPPMLWPPNSLDLNPVDYCVWNVLQERVYYCTKVDNVVDLKQCTWLNEQLLIIASSRRPLLSGVCDCMLVFSLPVNIVSIVCSDIIHSSCNKY